MGIPYSKQINAAFDQVTPLVAEGFEVLQTTRNITLLLAEIQIATVLLLFLLLVAIFMLLVTNNPDLERERTAIVTPIVRWLCSWMMSRSGALRYGFLILTVSLVLGSLLYAHYWYFLKRRTTEKIHADAVGDAEGEGLDATKDGIAGQ